LWTAPLVTRRAIASPQFSRSNERLLASATRGGVFCSGERDSACFASPPATALRCEAVDDAVSALRWSRDVRL